MNMIIIANITDAKEDSRNIIKLFYFNSVLLYKV